MARVLLVDDDPALRVALARVLSFAHQVTPVDSARAALDAIAASADAPFDAVICDVVMPEESGLALQATVAAQHPTLARRFVFITGGSRDELAVESLGLEVVLKPFSTASLEAALERTLARGAV